MTAHARLLATTSVGPIFVLAVAALIALCFVPRNLVVVDPGRLPSSDCWYEVGQQDVDGKPDGDKRTDIRVRCP